MDTNVNPKVTVAALASAVAGAVVWALGTYFFKGEVPEPVAILVVSAVTFAAGYLAMGGQIVDATDPAATSTPSPMVARCRTTAFMPIRSS